MHRHAARQRHRVRLRAAMQTKRFQLHRGGSLSKASPPSNATTGVGSGWGGSWRWTAQCGRPGNRSGRLGNPVWSSRSPAAMRWFESASELAHSKRCASSEAPCGSRQRLECGGLPPLLWPALAWNRPSRGNGIGCESCRHRLVLELDGRPPCRPPRRAWGAPMAQRDILCLCERLRTLCPCGPAKRFCVFCGICSFSAFQTLGVPRGLKLGAQSLNRGLTDSARKQAQSKHCANSKAPCGVATALGVRRLAAAG